MKEHEKIEAKIAEDKKLGYKKDKFMRCLRMPMRIYNFLKTFSCMATALWIIVINCKAFKEFEKNLKKS